MNLKQAKLSILRNRTLDQTTISPFSVLNHNSLKSRLQLGIIFGVDMQVGVDSS